MAFRGPFGIDPFFLGNGFTGTYAQTDDTPVETDIIAKEVYFNKNTPGDPSLVIPISGVRVFASERIVIGDDTTLDGSGNPGQHGIDGGFGGIGTDETNLILGGGSNGGDGGGINTPGNNGFDVDMPMSFGGAGGSVLSGTYAGGTAGVGNLAANISLISAQHLWSAINGHALIRGQLHMLGGGTGGGGGAGNVMSGGGGGAGGGVIILAAPEILVEGTITVNGGNGGNGHTDGAAGGGGGGGGRIVFVCGKLTFVGGGTLSANGGNGGNGNAGVTSMGGAGGAGGMIFVFSPDSTATPYTSGSAGSDGTSG